MNTHDIELPEHWQAFQYNEGWGSWEQVIPSAANKPGVVKAYTADQVIAAIEADRKHRLESRDALQRYKNCEGYKKPDPVARLRLYCALAMSHQDWLDVEPFFDDLIADRKQRSFTKPSTNQDWLSLDPAWAFHLIERHAENWNDAGSMMQAYLDAHIEADRKTYNPIGEGTIQQLHDVLLYLQNETMKLEAAYGSNFKKEATEKSRAATEKMKEAVYAIKNIDRKRRDEPVAWLYEDELPDNYPYEAMFPYSKVEGVRMFPVYAPQPAEPVKKKDWNVELSSWSDEDFVQVFHERPDLADRLRRALAEPVKVPSEEEVLKIAIDSGLAFRNSTGEVLCAWREDADISEYLVKNARALLERYIHLTTPIHKSSKQNQLKG